MASKGVSDTFALLYAYTLLNSTFEGLTAFARARNQLKQTNSRKRVGELSPLEIGMHVLKAVPKAQGKAGKGLAEYAEKIGKAKSTVVELRNAAEVAETCSGTRTSLLKKAEHLNDIHALPAACWPAMVEAL